MLNNNPFVQNDKNLNTSTTNSTNLNEKNNTIISTTNSANIFLNEKNKVNTSSTNSTNIFLNDKKNVNTSSTNSTKLYSSGKNPITSLVNPTNPFLNYKHVATTLTNSASLFFNDNYKLFNKDNINNEESSKKSNNENNNLNKNIFKEEKEESEKNKNNNKLGSIPINNKLNKNYNENIGRNNESKEIIQCNHSKYYVSFCTSNSKNDGGLICYECLYKYHQNHISKCIPIRNDSFNRYINNYKICINQYREKLKKVLMKVDSFLDYLENEEINDISTILENKLNLNFDLPIEVPFIDRFEIAINKKLTSYLKNELRYFNYTLLNVFKHDLENLKLFGNNPNNCETVKFISTINFNLYGIGITILNKRNCQSINIEIFKENTILKKKINFLEKYEEKPLSIGIFDSNPIQIESNIEYYIKLKNIGCLPYYEHNGAYNENSKVKIISSNSKTVLICLIV